MRPARALGTLALACAAGLVGPSVATAIVDVAVTGDVVHAAPGSSVLVTASITNLDSAVVYLNGITSAVTSVFAQDDAFDAFTALRPDSLGPGETWEGPILQLRIAASAPQGVSVFDLALTGGAHPFDAAEIGATYFAIDDSSAIAGVGGPTSPGASLRAGPNPFARETSIDFTAPSAGDYDVSVFDVSGRRLATLHSGPLFAGAHRWSWDGRIEGGGSASGGVFFIRASSRGRVLKTKVLKLE